MKEKIIPSIVLTLIAVIVSGLLVLANELTKDKIEAAQAEKISQSLSETFGDSNYTELGMNFEDTDKVKVNSAYLGDNGKVIFELAADGYAKEGLHILVGFDDKAELCGIGFLELGETPGLGTKVQEEKSFTDQFMGLSEKQEDFTPITGATFSSKGMKSAIDKAFEDFEIYKNLLYFFYFKYIMRA